jgi:ABC-2 type transport system permease protein
MNTMKWLIKREFWEHKGGFVWAPIVIGVILVVLTLTIVVFAGSADDVKIGISNSALKELQAADTAETRALIAKGIGNGVLVVSSVPFFLTFSLVSFFFCLGALFDERKDRSVLFWKSLPVSDAETVLSKVIVALVLAPLIALIVATAVALLQALLVSAGAAMFGRGGQVFGLIFGSPDLYLAPARFAAMLPIYVLWALPTVGWLLLVSAWAPSKPFLWAVGVPLVMGILISMASRMHGGGLRFDEWVWREVIGRGFLSIVPGSWFSFHRAERDLVAQMQYPDVGFMLTQSFGILASPNIWIGAALGAAMIYGAIRLRRWKDEG